VIYLDTSVLMSLLAGDAHTSRALAWLSSLQTTLIVSDLANLEVSAVLSRDLRTGRFTKSEVESALLDFDAFRAGCERLNHTVDDFVLAERVIRDVENKLAAADALHLASATNAGAELATFDMRLAEAAKGAGVELSISP